MIINDSFIRLKIYNYVEKKYKSKIEYLWVKFPNYVVFRNNKNNKWFGIIMDVSYNKLGVEREGIVDILNVKVKDDMMKDFLIHQKGIFKGYHISRGNWISVLLNETVKLEQIFNLIDESYNIVNSSNK